MDAKIGELHAHITPWAPRMTTKAEMIDWLERELANPPAEGCNYGVWVGPDPERGKCVYVHIPTEIVREQIRKALEAMKG